LDDPNRAAAQRDTLAELLRHSGVDTASLDAAGPYPAVAAAAQRGAIPLLATTEADPSARLAGLSRLLAALRTHKLIFVGPQGGISLRGERLEVVNLSTEYAALHASVELDPRQRELLDDARRLIFELVPHTLLVSIASPLNLLHELFTVKGAGTLLRKGARVTRHDGYAGVDVQRLHALLSSSFGKPVDEGFFERPLQHVYVDESYRGAALVLDTPLGGYLSKFAVTREAQGEGIGQDLWGALATDYPALIWRARGDNPIRPWYERKCQGRFSAEPWTVYFRGLAPTQAAAAIELALRQPVDF
jgi:acetylglutamate synthase